MNLIEILARHLTLLDGLDPDGYRIMDGTGTQTPEWELRIYKAQQVIKAIEEAGFVIQTKL